MDFSEALHILKADGRVYRASWLNKGRWLQLVDNHVGYYIFMYYPKGDASFSGARFPWIIAMGDLLAEDWYVVK